MKTLEEVAQRAAVSLATVSRVINNQPHVRPAIRERVLSAIRELGYVPNAAARTMVTRRTNIVGLMLPQVTWDWYGGDGTFYPMLLQSVSNACTVNERHLLLSTVPPGNPQMAREVLGGGHIDGVIASMFASADPVINLIATSHLPAVLIGRNPYYPELSWVDVDNFSSAQEAVSYLVRQGRRRIATLMLGTEGQAGVQRRDGYTRALLNHGLALDPALLLEPSRSGDDGYAAMQQLLDLPNRPDAVFAAADGMALRALDAIRERGLRVPEDIAVIGFDDQPSASRAGPPLTTVRQPIMEMGTQATALLLRLIDAPEAGPLHMVLPTQLVIRQSA
ncbi:MAG: LacI family transcriptional regulator [Chloroflexaceae bacterium]|jgi:LacI family transcriptional regulator|nr:LacI family transcriptional regulator [Chloroflexaceae bacterium]